MEVPKAPVGAFLFFTMKSKAYVFLADGFEEIEAVAPADILRRSTKNVQLVALGDNLTVRSTHGITLVADLRIEEFLQEYEADRETPPDKTALVFPGGLPGATNLAACAPLMQLAARHFAEGGLLCAICASPGTLLPVIDGLLREEGRKGIGGRRFTCYPGCEEGPLACGALHEDSPCVTDGLLITANGPGAAMEFGYAITSALVSPPAAEVLKMGMMYTYKKKQ